LTAERRIGGRRRDADVKLAGILVMLAAFCGAVAIGLDQFGAVEPAGG
jgi:hypothetical protein